MGMLSYKLRYRLSQLHGEKPAVSADVRKRRRRISGSIAALILILYLLSPFFAVARLQVITAVQGGPSPLGHILYYRQVDSGFAVQVMGEKLFWGEGRCNAYPYFVVRKGLFWHAVQMNENTCLLFQEPGRQTSFYVSDSFAERLGPYTILCIGSRFLEGNHISAEQLNDSEGTEPLLLSHETLRRDVDWGHWGTLDSESAEVWFRTRDLSGYGLLFIVKDMPEDYQLNCGDRVITAAEIQALFQG